MILMLNVNWRQVSYLNAWLQAASLPAMHHTWQPDLLPPPPPPPQPSPFCCTEPPQLALPGPSMGHGMVHPALNHQHLWHQGEDNGMLAGMGSCEGKGSQPLLNLPMSAPLATAAADVAAAAEVVVAGAAAAAKAAARCLVLLALGAPELPVLSTMPQSLPLRSLLAWLPPVLVTVPVFQAKWYLSALSAGSLGSLAAIETIKCY